MSTSVACVASLSFFTACSFIASHRGMFYRSNSTSKSAASRHPKDISQWKSSHPKSTTHQHTQCKPSFLHTSISSMKSFCRMLWTSSTFLDPIKSVPDNLSDSIVFLAASVFANLIPASRPSSTFLPQTHVD